MLNPQDVDMDFLPEKFYAFYCAKWEPIMLNLDKKRLKNDLYPQTQALRILDFSCRKFH